MIAAAHPFPPLAATSIRRHATAALLATVALGSLPGQQDAPPWWLVQDNDTVSVAWEFTTQPPAGQPITPTTELGPAWYGGSSIPPINGLNWQANLTNHQGVMAYSAQGFAQVVASIGNDPRPNHIKMLWIQFDYFETPPRSLKYQLAASPNYTRHNIKIDVQSLGQGWSRVTMEGELRPQPVGEDFLWDLLPGTGTLALDNIYVNTRCVPLDNEVPEGDALGEPTGYLVDVTAATGNTDCFGCAYTDLGPAGEVFWVSGRSQGPTARHEFYGFDAVSGALLFTLPQAAGPATTATGLLDLATAQIRNTGTFVYGGFANPQGIPELHAFDPATQTWDPNRTLTVPALAGLLPLALSFNPDGNRGRGTFWLGDQQGDVHEIDLAGNVLRTAASGAAILRGGGYDPIRGELYWFGRGGSTDPRNIEALGVVVDVRNLQPTGARFYGSFAAGSTGSPTGRALGLDFFRKPSPRQPRVVAMANRNNTSLLYEMHATYRYGLSCFGDISMNFRAPFLGGNQWAVTLRGAPAGAFAVLYLGFSKQISGTTPLPFSLGLIGLPECAILQSLDLEMGTTTVGATGRAAVIINLPNLPGLSYTPTYWQWAMFGAEVPGGIATSPAAKTVLY